MKIISIISNLNKGGAEGNFYRLNTFYVIRKYEVLIICLTKKGYYSDLLENKKIKVYHLNLNRGKITISSLLQMYKIIKKFSPNVVQTWMYHSDLIGGIISKIAGVNKIHWNIRHGSFKLGSSKITTIIIAFLCSIFSYFIPNKIIFNSYFSKKFHSKIFYCKNKMKVIHNGIDTNFFKPNNNEKNYLKDLYKINNKFIIGMVARLDRQKDHLTFLESIRIFKYRFKINDFHVFLIGKNIIENTDLLTIINQKKLFDNITLIDHYNEINKIMNSLDLHVLSSKYGDSFPNVILESMSCSTPCISTNIGDSKLIINNDKLIAEIGNASSLSNSILHVYKIFQNYSEWIKFKKNIRNEIVNKFKIDNMTNQYEKIL